MMNVTDQLVDAQAFVAGLKAQFNSGVVPDGFVCESVAVSDRGRLQVRFVADPSAETGAGESSQENGVGASAMQSEPALIALDKEIVFDRTAAPSGRAGFGVGELSDQESDALVLSSVRRSGFDFPTLDGKELAEIAARTMAGDALLAIEAYAGSDPKLYAKESIAASREVFAETFDVALFDACIARWAPAEVAGLLGDRGGAV